MSETWAELLERPEIDFGPNLPREVVAGRRVLITGAGGSVGRALARTVAAADPARLVLLDWHEASLFHLEQALAAQWPSDDRSGPRFLLADVRDRRQMDRLLRHEKVDLIFHLAACKHVALGEANPDQAVSVNIGGTLDLFGVAAERDVSTFVYPSTDKAVNPSSLYGATKRIVERSLPALAEASGPNARIIRLVNVFGTQGSVVETFAGLIRAGRPLTITDERMDRYWMTMAEANRLLLAAAERPRFEGIYLLDVGAPVPIVETARKLHRLLRGGGEPSLRIIGARPGERLHEYLAYPAETVLPTDRPGLLLAQPARAGHNTTSWLAAVRALIAERYDLEPASVRDRTFELARAATPAAAFSGESGWS
ncbi:MAG TPA: polysaccharide biosynthesis protein [Chloroflexota bacterium]|nr:polysaccharide biosynthesis protein [Chloroflexota bacterium]